MNCGNRGGEADHAADGSRGVLGELGNRQRQPIEPIRRSGHVAANNRKSSKFGKRSADDNKGGSTIGSAAADDEKSMEALGTGGETGQRSAAQEALLPEPNWAGMSHNQRNKWRRRKSKKK